MRKFYNCLFFVLFLAIKVNGQNITVAELTSLTNKKSWPEVDVYLTSKGWIYHDSQKGDEGKYDVITWSYKKDSYSDKAQGWFYVYSDNGNVGIVKYVVFNKAAYLIIQKAINGPGYKMTESNIEDDAVITKYESSNYLIEISYSKRMKEDYEYSDVSLTAYEVTVQKKAASYKDLSGLQEYTDDDGNQIKASFKNGVLHGLLQKYNPEGTLILTLNFVNGEKTGLSTEYDEVGRLSVETNYFNGKLNGKYVRYNYGEEGIKITTSGQFLDGEKNGIWTTKKNNGKDEYLLIFHTYENGILNGSFKEVSGDSIILGTYKNAELNGKYTVYSSIYTLITGEITGDTTGAVKTSEGYYNSGFKSGYWKNYSITQSLLAEGKYVNNERQGEWKFYHNKFSDENTVDGFGELFLIEYYDNGKKNGKSVQFSKLIEDPIPCDLNKYPDKTPLDTCTKRKIVKENIVVYYKDDKLHGPFEIRDSLDILVLRGVYVNDERNGIFIEGYEQINPNGGKYYVYEEGEYINGDREGDWKSYLHKAFVNQKYSYKHGVLDGKNTYYNASGKPRKEVFYENGVFKELIIYDSIGSIIKKRYQIISESQSSYRCNLIQYFNNEIVSQHYYIPKDQNNPIFPEWFDLTFQIKTSEEINGIPDAYPDGDYTLADEKENILIEGGFLRKEKIGTWKYFFPGSGVYMIQEFTNNVPGTEYYYEQNSNNPYSGELKLYYPNGKLKTEIEISKGTRNGKSKYYTEDGKRSNTEKYKNGILIK